MFHGVSVHDLYAQVKGIMINKLVTIILAGHVARREQLTNPYQTVADKLNVREGLEKLGVGGRITLNTRYERVWIGVVRLSTKINLAIEQHKMTEAVASCECC
jgi:hypothetical protein